MAIYVEHKTIVYFLTIYEINYKSRLFSDKISFFTVQKLPKSASGATPRAGISPSDLVPLVCQRRVVQHTSRTAREKFSGRVLCWEIDWDVIMTSAFK